MKIFVTKEHLQKAIDRVKQMKIDLHGIRKEKSVAFQGDTNAWHDNFAYESLTREEKMAEDKLLKAANEMENYIIMDSSPKTQPETVEIYCWVKVLEQNVTTLKQLEKMIGLVPLGAEDYKKLIYSYNAPIVSPLMGAKVGEERVIKIPMGIFKMKILEIQRMASK